MRGAGGVWGRYMWVVWRVQKDPENVIAIYVARLPRTKVNCFNGKLNEGSHVIIPADHLLES